MKTSVARLSSSRRFNCLNSSEEKIELNVIRPKADMPDFKKSVRLTLESLEGRLNNKVVADWYPRLQKQSSLSQGGGAIAKLNQEPLRTEHLAFLTGTQFGLRSSGTSATRRITMCSSRQTELAACCQARGGTSCLSRPAIWIFAV